mgnify:CR=1 FL=1
MSEKITKFTNKVSPLIEGQVPDFVQADHPLFVKFVQDYFEFLEAGRLTLTTTVNYVSLETNTVAYIIDEQDSERILTEIGEGTVGKFINGETITGGTSKATAKVLVDDSRNSVIYITGQQRFETGELVTGGTSGSTGTVASYQSNPIQTIQQMLEYADVDNTLYEFLDNMRDEFMNAIPDTLASGINKRTLIKNIKDLYAAKGTSEGHKLFMRMLLGEESEIFYPNIYMMRASQGDWESNTIIRAGAVGASRGDEVVNQLITGGTSGATAIVENAVTKVEQNENFNDSVIEFTVANIQGTFVDGETITGLSTVKDVVISFTLFGIVSDTAITNDGILYTNGEEVDVELVGNQFATIEIDGVNTGSVSELFVETAGTGYEVGDTLTFTKNSADTDVKEAIGVVSMVGGGILQETGTLDKSTITTDTIILEEATNSQLESFTISLETTNTDNFIGDGETTVFNLSNTSGTLDVLTVYLDDVLYKDTSDDNTAQWAASETQITFTFAPKLNQKIHIRGNEIDNLILDGTDGNSKDAGHQILTDSVIEVLDTYTTTNDQIVLEFDTFTDIDAGATDEAGHLIKAVVTDGGFGYSKLPTVSITSTSGASGSIHATTTDIGSVKATKITNAGFRYTASNPPEPSFRAHFVLKDVSGTFAAGNTLVSSGHTGTIKSWDTNTKVLDTTFQNVIRVEQEQSNTFNEGIQLEQGTELLTPEGVLLEDEQEFDDTEGILLDGTGTFTPAAQSFTYKVKVVYDSTLEQNVYEINGANRPALVLYEGNTYYFDLSDSSLYNESAAAQHIFRLSETSDGTHNSGSEYTDGVTKSASTIDVGTTGAFLQIIVPSGAPVLYYYCTNHSGMGNSLATNVYDTIVLDEGDNVILDGTDRFDHFFLVEEGTVGNATDRIQLESQGVGGFLIDEDFDSNQSKLVQLATAGGKLLQVSIRRENATSNSNDSQFILLNGTDANGSDAGDRLANEDFGNSLVLEEDRANFLLDDETGDGQITFDSTATGSVDTDGHVINEEPIDFSLRDVVITDSGGASATIVTADIATGTTSVAVTSTSTAAYANIQNRLGEDLIRIQDSYYYQDYSYEVQIGASFSTYVNELKKAVHPAGFQPFGRVTLATLISAEIGTAGAGIAAYTGDTDTFSPILASTFQTIFDQLIQRRLEAFPVSEIGVRDQTIILEDGTLPGSNLVLEDSLAGGGRNIVWESGTSGVDGDAGDAVDLEDGFQMMPDHVDGGHILYETNTVTHTFDETHGVGTGGSRMMSEKSYTPSGDGDSVLVKEIVIKISARPKPKFQRNLLTYLAEYPFGNELGGDGILMEGTTFSDFDVIQLDGTLPLDQADTFFQLERDTQQDNLLLDGTSATAADSGDDVLLEDGFLLKLEDVSLGRSGETFNIAAEGDDGHSRILQEGGEWNFPAGFVVNEGDRIILDGSNNNEETIPLSEIGHYRFSDILREDKLIINDGNTNNFIKDAGVDVGIQLEDFGQILLEDGEYLGQETTKRNRFNLEENGSLITEIYDTTSIVDILLDETNGDTIVLEDATESRRWFKSTYTTDTTATTSAIALETTNVVASFGQMPVENLTINSSQGGLPVVRSADIQVRDTGDVALEDATDTTHGFLVNETNGDNIQFEGATGITY